MVQSSAFKTDLYELTQAQAAIQGGTGYQKAIFEVFTRRLPTGRRYAILAGVNRVLEEVKNFRFTRPQLQYLEAKTKADGSKLFTKDFLKFLEDYRFSGEIIGYQEGEVFFPYSPVMTVHGTFADAVLLETLILSILNYDSAVASAASRMVVAAKGRPIVEMGSRRANEDAAVAAARAAYIAGFSGSSNVEAGLRYGVPTVGTSAHAFTLAFPTEEAAFKAQVNSLGASTTLLVDTYNIQEGIQTAVKVAGAELGAIRIDSGDLREETIKARELLDSLGNTSTKILLSSDLDEYSISEIIDGGTPADIFGAGTQVVTGSGAPTMGMVFKLVEIEENGRMKPVAKKSTDKGSIGGEKTVGRIYKNGILEKELIFINSEMPKDLAKVQKVLYKNGEPLLETLEEARDRRERALEALPTEAKLITAGKPHLTSEAV